MLSRIIFGTIALFYCSTLFAAAVTKPLRAQEVATLPQTFEGNAILKQKEHEDLLISIENWLSSQFDLPTINHHPRVELVAPSTIASLAYKKLLSDPSVLADSEMTGSQPDTVSLYDDVTQTIYLPKGWAGSADVEVSVLVHEMVHHFQNLLGFKYACAQEREKLAYMAQDRWLARSGLSLASEFDLDPFSLLVATTCKY